MPMTPEQKTWMLENIPKAKDCHQLVDMFKLQFNEENYRRKVDGWIMQLRKEGHVIIIPWRPVRQYVTPEVKDINNRCVEAIMDQNYDGVSALLNDTQIITGMATDLGRDVNNLRQHIFSQGPTITNMINHKRNGVGYTQDPEDGTTQVTPVQQPVSSNTMDKALDPFLTEGKPHQKTIAEAEMDTKISQAHATMIEGVLRGINPNLTNTQASDLAKIILPMVNNIQGESSVKGQAIARLIANDNPVFKAIDQFNELSVGLDTILNCKGGVDNMFNEKRGITFITVHKE